MTNPEIDKDGNKRWYNSNKQLHRDDGPSYESPIFKAWHINGKSHRDDGPAVEWSEWNGGRKEWWIRNIDITIEVNQWIKDNNFPEYEKWDDSIKVLFKLKFG